MYPDWDADKGCVYVKNRKPACIVALALHKAGVSIKKLRGEDGANTKGIDLRVDLTPLMTPRAVNIFSYAQDAQDGGDTWGTSVDHARWANERIIVDKDE